MKMSTRDMLKRGIIALAVGALSTLAFAEEAELTKEQLAERQREVAAQLAKIPNPLSVYDYVTFGVAGPVVILEGFATKRTVKPDAVKVVKELDWVVHVVDKIEYLPAEPAGRGLRKETYSLLKKSCPEAFPQHRAYIRIKVLENKVTLVGSVDAGAQERLEAAVLRIRNLPLVQSVDNQVELEDNRVEEEEDS
jgi:hypothetical protein